MKGLAESAETMQYSQVHLKLRPVALNKTRWDKQFCCTTVFAFEWHAGMLRKKSIQLDEV